MKKTVIILVSFFLTEVAICQNYYPLPESNVIWQVSWGESGCFEYGWFDNYQYSISGDTLINSINYHKIERSGYFECYAAPLNPFIGYLGAFRNDIENKKVWVVPRDSLNEMLLYDFDLNIGDTIKGYLYIVSESQFGLPNTAVINNIDSIEIGANFRKRWHYQGSSPFWSGTIIEGIGCEFGLLDGLCAMMDNNGDLNCFSIDNQTLYPNSSPEPCELTTSILDSETETENSIFCYPNPTKKTIQVSGIQKSNIHSFKLYDPFGRLLDKNTFRSNQVINLENRKNGIYYLEFLDENKTSLNLTKIIKY